MTRSIRRRHGFVVLVAWLCKRGLEIGQVVEVKVKGGSV